MPERIEGEPFVVRHARRADAADISAIWTDLMRLHALLDSRFSCAPGAQENYRRHIIDRVRWRDGIVLTAEDARGAVVGFLVASVHERPAMANPGPYGFISDVCVREDCRRRGIGRALYEEAHRWLVSRKVRSIELYVAEANPDAQAFWGALGLSPFLQMLHKDLS